MTRDRIVDLNESFSDESSSIDAGGIDMLLIDSATAEKLESMSEMYGMTIPELVSDAIERYEIERGDVCQKV